MPKMALYQLVKDLVIADRRLQKSIPVDQSFPPVDEIFAKQIKERTTDCPRTNLIERKARPLPVAAATHLF